MTSTKRKQIFISYAHEDVDFLKRLQVHLAPYQRNNRITINVWDDTKITPGSNWRSEIEEAIASTKVAVVLVSADFLASRFIAEYELPSLLEAAKTDNTVIIPVIVSPSAFEQSELSQFQAINSPDEPLSKMTRHESEELWTQVAWFACSIVMAQITNKKSSLDKAAEVGENLWRQFEVTEIIGRTNHSLIVKAWDISLRRFVAIKLIYTDQDPDGRIVEQLKQMLMREARIVSNLEHQNIGKVYHIQLEPPAIIMQLIEGKSLSERLQMGDSMSIH
jgi:hypothetical protein